MFKYFWKKIWKKIEKHKQIHTLFSVMACLHFDQTFGLVLLNTFVGLLLYLEDLERYL